MPYLEYTDAKSSKFWEGGLEGIDLWTRWGKIGSKGQQKSKTFGSTALAEQALAKLVVQKVKKGYVEVEPEEPESEQEGARQEVPASLIPTPALPQVDPHVAVVPRGTQEIEWTPEALALIGALPDHSGFELPLLMLDRDQLWADIAACPRDHGERVHSSHGVARLRKGFEVASAWCDGKASASEIDRDVLLFGMLFWEDEALELLVRYAASLLGVGEACALFIESLKYSFVLTQSKTPESTTWHYFFELDIFCAARREPSYSDQSRSSLHVCAMTRAICTVRRMMCMIDGEELAKMRQAVDAIYASLTAEHRLIICALYPDDEALKALEARATHHQVGQVSALKLLGTRQHAELMRIMSADQHRYTTTNVLTIPTLLYEQGIKETVSLTRRLQRPAQARDFMAMIRSPGVIVYWEDFVFAQGFDTLDEAHAQLANFPVLAVIECATHPSPIRTLFALRLLRLPGVRDDVLDVVKGKARAFVESLCEPLESAIIPAKEVPPLLAAPPWRVKKKATKTLKIKGLEPPSLPVCVEVPDGVPSPPVRTLSYNDAKALLHQVEPAAEGQLKAHRAWTRVFNTNRLFTVRDVQMLRSVWALAMSSDYWMVNTQSVPSLQSGLAMHREGVLELMCELGVNYPAVLVPVLQYTTSVPTARIMAEAAHRITSQRSVARRWLDGHAAYACAALLADAVGEDRRLRTQAEAAIMHIARDPSIHDDIREMLAAHYDDERVLSYADDLLARDPLDAHPARVKALPDWLEPGALHRPRLVSAPSRGLDDDAMRALLEMCSFYDVEQCYAGFEQIEQSLSHDSLARFAHDILGQWLAFDGSSKTVWCLQILGRWGNDDTVRMLTPLIRRWPSESAAKRAQWGLDVLAQIGTDVALMHIYGMSRKMKFASLKAHAGKLVDQIARERELTSIELGDRLVPDFDLDVRGRLTLDYGPRQFVVTLDEYVQPTLRDVSHDRWIKALPKPNGSDDAELAKLARSQFSGFKKDLKVVARQQLQRLEDALITQRRWAAADFERFLVQHPLMLTLTARLLWGVFDSQGQLTQTFRVDLDHSIVDVNDEPVDLSGLEVGMLHPSQLTPEQNESWQAVIGDYEIIQPFDQLGRVFYPAEQAFELLREKVIGAKLSAPKLVFGLERLGWKRGYASDGGAFYEHTRAIDAHHAFQITYDGAVGMGYIEQGELLTILDLYVHTEGDAWEEKTPELEQCLAQCSEITLSEITGELIRLMES